MENPIIKIRIEYVEGDFDMATEEIISVSKEKYADVDLCFKGPMHIPFAQIRLHSKDLWINHEAVFDDARRLGKEIERRWNGFLALEERCEEMEEKINK